jgi:hypothetical protein
LSIGALEAAMNLRLLPLALAFGLAVAGCNAGRLAVNPLAASAASSTVDTLTATSGDQQTAPAGGPIPQPMVLTATSGGNPVPGATVAFQVTSGGGTVSTPSATTDQQGQVTASLILGSVPGANTVVASVGTVSVTFTETGQ